MSTTPLTLSFAGQQPPIALPQVPGTRGPVGVDMRGLNQSGFCSYDPGFANTAGCQSAISWIDTENSVLLHRGYPVDQLARQCDFLEVAYIMRTVTRRMRPAIKPFARPSPAILWSTSR